MQKSWQTPLDKGKICVIIPLATDESTPTDVRKYDAFPALKIFEMGELKIMKAKLREVLRALGLVRLLLLLFERLVSGLNKRRSREEEKPAPCPPLFPHPTPDRNGEE